MTENTSQGIFICNALRALVPFVQFKKREKHPGGMLLLVKLQVEAVPTDPLNSTLNSTLLKVTLLHWCFSRFLNCTNRTKSRKASDIRFFSYSDVANIQVQI